jgi:PhzF family phenazine biosynthesis protein
MKNNMITIPITQIDAFTDRAFAGNPAAVMVLDHWLEDRTLQAIAAENNLAETAFLVRDADKYLLRWFTPTVEVDLCGHATLASGHHVLGTLEPGRADVTFMTRSGPLRVTRAGDRLAMDFPARPMSLAPDEAIPAVSRAIGAEVLALRQAWAYLAELKDEATVRDLRPDIAAIRQLPLDLVVTAPGSDCDFVSRVFVPKFGIPEDPVTGLAHCSLGPYWGEKLGKKSMFARQVSPRGGEIWLELAGERVTLSGHCMEVLSGTMTVPH